MADHLQPAAPWLRPNSLDTGQIWRAMVKLIRTLDTPEAKNIQGLLAEYDERRRKMYQWP